MNNSLTLELYQKNNLILHKNNIQYKLVNDIISFTLDDINYEIDLNNKIFTRKNNEFEFILYIEKKECTYLLKEANTTFDINVEESTYNKENNIINIYYDIESLETSNTLIITLEESK